MLQKKTEDSEGKTKAMRGHLALAALIAAAFCWAVFGSAHLFPYFSEDRDEGVYVFQALNLLKGRLTVPIDPLSPFFRIWFQGPVGDHLAFKYTPVHALLLAVGKALFGSFRVSLGLIAAFDIGFIYLLGLELQLPRRAALLASGFLLLSPLFLILSATYLSYLSFLGWTLAALVCLLRARRLSSKKYYLAGGALLVVCFFARPFDGVIVSCCAFASFRRDWREFKWMILGGAPFVVLTGLNNWHVMGYPWRFSFSQDPLDTLGFGMKRMVSAQPAVLFGSTQSIQATLAAAGLLVAMAWGGAVSLGFVIAALRRKQKMAPGFTAVTFLFVAYPTAYFFFWGHYMFLVWGALYYLGPVYFVPLLMPFNLVCAREVDKLLTAKAKLGTAVLAFMAICSAVVMFSMVEENLKRTEQARRLIAPAEAPALDNSVMFLPPIDGPVLGNAFPHLMNSPDPSGPILYAVDLGSANFKLLDAFPARSPYRMELLPEAKRGNGPPSQLIRLRYFRGPTLERTFEISNPSELSRLEFLIAYTDSTKVCTLDTASRKDKAYQIRLQVTDDAIRLSGVCAGGDPSVFPGPGESGFRGISIKFSGGPQDIAEYGFRYDLRGRGANGVEALLPAKAGVVFAPQPSESERPAYLAAVKEIER